tara:strand:- start:1339 stop:1485 length:147 start_codon:yes stop_codon:yes gene_type:complete
MEALNSTIYFIFLDALIAKKKPKPKSKVISPAKYGINGKKSIIFFIVN